MANRYFLNVGTNFNTTANWSTTSGGAAGASVPTSSDVVILDNNSGPLSLEININVQGISMTAGYASTFTQNAFTINYGSAFWTVAGGTFVGSSSAIAGSTSSRFIMSGGTFTSTSGTHTIGVAGSGVYSIDITGGVFNHNSGTMLMFGANHSGARNLSGYPFWNYTQNQCPSCSGIGGAIVYVDNNYTCTSTAGGSTISVKGNVVITVGSPSLIFTGGNNQSLTSGTNTLGNITFNKSGGTLSINNDLIWNGNWTHTAGTINWNGYQVKCLITFNTATLTNFNVYKLEIAHTSGVGIVSAGVAPIVETDVIFNASVGASFFPSISLKGNLSILTANGTCSGITFNGTGSQSWTSSVATYNLGSVAINKSAGTVSLMSNFEMLGATNDLNLILGTFNQNGFNLKLQDTINQGDGVYNQGTGSLDCSRVVISGGVFNEGIQGITLRGADFLVSGAGQFNRNLTGGGIFANNAVATALNVNTNGWEISVFKFARLTANLTLLASLQVAKDFEKTSTATTANVIGGGFMVRIGGNYKQNNQYSSRALATSPTWILNGAGDQEVFTFDGKFDSGNWRVDKPSGKVVQMSHVTIDNGQAGDNGLNSLLVFKGIWCTNQFNLTVDDDIAISGLGELDKTPSSVITGTVVGTITNVSNCSQKKTNFFAYLMP